MPCHRPSRAETRGQPNLWLSGARGCRPVAYHTVAPTKPRWRGRLTGRGTALGEGISGAIDAPGRGSAGAALGRHWWSGARAMCAEKHLCRYVRGSHLPHLRPSRAEACHGLALGVILLLIFPEFLVAKGRIAGGCTSPDAAAGERFGLRQIGRVVGLKVAL